MTHHPLVKPFLMVGATILILLLVPLGAMQLTGEVAWGPGDFVVATLLLCAAGTAFVVTARRTRSVKGRVAVALLILAVLATVWAELAVGILR